MNATAAEPLPEEKTMQLQVCMSCVFFSFNVSHLTPDLHESVSPIFATSRFYLVKCRFLMSGPTRTLGKMGRVRNVVCATGSMIV